MTGVITRYYKEAWLAGAKECGIKEADLTPKELRALKEITNAQFIYLFGYADAIEAGSKANGGLLRDVYARAELWVNRYGEVKTAGNEMACADMKTEWVWTERKKHCCDCRTMNGRVYRNSVWKKYGIRPQSAALACFGGHCGCFKRKTDKPVTPGRPPALKGPGGC